MTDKDHIPGVEFIDDYIHESTVTHLGQPYTGTYVVEEGNVRLTVKLGRLRFSEHAPVGSNTHQIVAERLMRKIISSVPADELY